MKIVEKNTSVKVKGKSILMALYSLPKIPYLLITRAIFCLSSPFLQKNLNHHWNECGNGSSSVNKTGHEGGEQRSGSVWTMVLDGVRDFCCCQQTQSSKRVGKHID